MDSEIIKSGASSVASARESLEERAAAAAASLAEKMRAKAAERAAAATAKAVEKARKDAERETAKAEKAAERAAAAAAEKARVAVEKEAAAAARKAAAAAKKAEKDALPKRPRGRPKKVAPGDAASAVDDFESVAEGSDGEVEVKPCPPASATAIHLDVDAIAETEGFTALCEPSPRPMRHIASLQAENAALRARLERAEAALAAIRAALP